MVVVAASVSSPSTGPARAARRPYQPSRRASDPPAGRGCPPLGSRHRDISCHSRTPAAQEAEARARRDEILAIATLHGATNVGVLGSVVPGEAGPEHPLHRRVDVVTENGLRPHVKEPILREAVAL